MGFVLGVVGSRRRTGKTTAVETITRYLVGKGIRVCTVKHAESPFDMPEKDTSRHLEAGASAAIALTQNEIVEITREDRPRLEDAIGRIGERADLILVEGLKDADIPKILMARTGNEANAATKELDNIIAVSGAIVERPKEISKIERCIQAVRTEDLPRLVEGLLLKDMIKRLPGVNCKKCGYNSCIEMSEAILQGKATIRQCLTLGEDLSLVVNGKSIPLSPFPKDFIENTVLAMVRSLKGVEFEEGILELKLKLKTDSK